ncbi:MAG: type IV toxin-antitoxin system AbiEi family antitoxin domain-containing protein [Ignavibacteria bacterium]|nr:MAG: type IV toxin-antitoxin system AbiEi family antitoxin domain-containing protein [Ignavibacteria bacterium]
MYLIDSKNDSFSKMEKIVKYIENNGGFARMKDLREKGFQTRDIAALVKEGVIEKVKPGIYKLADYGFFEDKNVSLLSVCNAIPNAVICLISALDYYELTLFNPSEIYYAIPNSEKVKKIDYPPVKPFFFRDRFYYPGIEYIKTKYGEIRIYNKEKTVCDMFRYRNKLGEDIALEGLKNYQKLRKKNIGKLIEYSEICQVKTVMMPILKGLVA